MIVHGVSSFGPTITSKVSAVLVGSAPSAGAAVSAKTAARTAMRRASPAMMLFYQWESRPRAGRARLRAKAIVARPRRHV